jgi:hypothetical protein
MYLFAYGLAGARGGCAVLVMEGVQCRDGLRASSAVCILVLPVRLIWGHPRLSTIPCSVTWPVSPSISTAFATARAADLAGAPGELSTIPCSAQAYDSELSSSGTIPCSAVSGQRARPFQRPSAPAATPVSGWLDNATSSAKCRRVTVSHPGRVGSCYPIITAVRL